MTQPLVSCVLITGKDPARIPLALAAVCSVVQQSHRPLELLVINDSRTPLTVGDFSTDVPIRERMVGGGLTLGELRNIGLDEARGSWLAQTDDDDWSHPKRIEIQLAAAIEHNCPVTLLNQVRYSFITDNAFVLCQRPRPDYKVGIPGTVLHPKTEFRYPAERLHEDTHFLKQFERVHIIDNMPELYLRFSHGKNSWSSRHIMQRHDQGQHRRDLPSAANGYLNHVLKEHYASFQRVPAGRPPAA